MPLFVSQANGDLGMSRSRSGTIASTRSSLFDDRSHQIWSMFCVEVCPDVNKPQSVVKWSCSFLAVAFAVATVVLVSVWAAYDSPGFLYVPNWSTNIFSWHPLLMTAGFYFSQIMGFVSLTLLPSKNTQCCAFDNPRSQPASIACTPWTINAASLARGFWEAAGCATLVAGLIAVFAYSNGNNLPNLTQLHSWLGIMTSVLYFANFVVTVISIVLPAGFLGNLWGDLVYGTNSDILRVSFESFHRALATFSLMMSVVAVLSGIVQYQGLSGCYFTPYPYSLPSPDVNPALHYAALPNGCKVSNGLGIVVVLAFFSVMPAHVVGYVLPMVMSVVQSGVLQEHQQQREAEADAEAEVAAIKVDVLGQKEGSGVYVSFLGKGEGLESQLDKKTKDDEERKNDDPVDRSTLLSAPAAVISAPTASSHASSLSPVVPTDVIRPPSLPMVRRGLLGKRDAPVETEESTGMQDGGEVQTINAATGSLTVPPDRSGHVTVGATIEAATTTSADAMAATAAASTDATTDEVPPPTKAVKSFASIFIPQK